MKKAMRGMDVPVENVAEIGWGIVLVTYLLGAGRPELLQPAVLLTFAASAAAAFLELYLRKVKWPYMTWYDVVVWSILLTGMVFVTGGRGSEVWPAYILMSLTAPSVANPAIPYPLLGINALLYALVYLFHNPWGVPLDLGLLCLRIGTFFLVTWVVDRSMIRERQANGRAVRLAHERVGELVRARDAERQRIASDIHDWLGAGLIAPMRKLEEAVRSADLAQTRQRADEVVETLRHSHGELRRIMENLHPHLLEQMGLSEGLHSYLRGWGEECGMAMEFVLEEGPEPPPAMAVALFRIQQEALNNVAKHAGARMVSVRLILSPHGVRLLVSDDGRGFTGRVLDVDRQEPGSDLQGWGSEGCGRGLATMRERAAAFGGRVSIHSRPGQGTTVDAELPVESRRLTPQRR